MDIAARAMHSPNEYKGARLYVTIGDNISNHHLRNLLHVQLNGRAAQLAKFTWCLNN